MAKSTKSVHPRTGAQCIIDGLIKAGCDTLFAYPGGQIIDTFDALFHAKGIHVILARHEQGLVHEADGYARATGKVGCCLVTSGPGATNTVTGLATAHMDGVPLVCIAGQVPLSLIGNDAFQEADTTGITRSVTKHNYLVKSVDELPHIIAEAFFVAKTGKPGPVLIDVPKDVQRALTDRPSESPDEIDIPSYTPFLKPDPDQLTLLANVLNRAHRPVLYVGGGAFPSNASQAIADLAHAADIPVITTLMGLGAFPQNDPLSLGMVGMHGTAAANRAVCECDFILSAGARFDDRVIGKASEFARGATVAHIDIDDSAIGKSIPTDIRLLSDLKAALEALLPLIKKNPRRQEWIERTAQWKRKFPYQLPKESTPIKPQRAIKAIDLVTRGDAIIVTDVGQHQMWAAQFYTYTKPRTYLSSGGLGTMGFGIPAAIGAQLGCPKRKVVSISGDGGAQMNFQELVVAVEHRLPIVFVILNNTYLGMVRQWQQLFYGKRYSSVALGQKGRHPLERIPDNPRSPYLPDFVKLAEAHGALAERAFTEKELCHALRKALKASQPTVIECIVEPEENVFPMVPPGMPLSEMVFDDNHLGA